MDSDGLGWVTIWVVNVGALIGAIGSLGAGLIC